MNETMTLGIFALALEGGSVGIGVDRVPHMTSFEGWLDRLCQCLGIEASSTCSGHKCVEGAVKIKQG